MSKGRKMTLLFYVPWFVFLLLSPFFMCGEAAANPKLIPLLMAFGLTEFSVSAPSVLQVRKCISGWTKEKADEIAEKVMSFTTVEEIEKFLSEIA